jgi:hypothetical protein
VAASETEAPHVSRRANCYTLRYGHHHADYLLVSANSLDPDTAAHTRAAVATGDYGLVDRAGPFTLWRLGADRSRNAEGLGHLGLDATPQP